MPLIGDRVILREERAEDLGLLLRLRNEPDTQGWNKSLPPDYTEPMERNRFESTEYSVDRASGRFMIERRATGLTIGYIRYDHVRPRWDCVFGIAIDRADWGRGLAFDAQEVLLRFLFVDLGLRVVRLWTHGRNERALRLAERSGFQIAFRQREALYMAGILADNVQMDLLREEFFARHPELEDELPPIKDLR